MSDWIMIHQLKGKYWNFIYCTYKKQALIIHKTEINPRGKWI